jgi:hypothetical protein
MNKKHLLIGVSLLIICFSACKNKDENKESFFPVLAIIQNQVAEVDSSVYAIRKIVIEDSTSDTTFVRREDFANLAKDFLQTPDISQKKLKRHYTESKFFDESLHKVIITYIPDNETLELRRQEIHITPDQVEGDKINTIIMDKFISNKDSNIQKRLLWQMNDHFQVVTIIQKPGEKERAKTIKVMWK